MHLQKAQSRMMSFNDEQIIRAYSEQKNYDEFEAIFVRDFDCTPSNEVIDSKKLLEDSPRRGRRSHFNDAEFCERNPLQGKMLEYCIRSLDNIVSEPFVYFAKRPDPISIHTAIEYISNNELTDTIYVIHFVDDRRMYSSNTSSSILEANPSEEVFHESMDMVMLENLQILHEQGAIERSLSLLPNESKQLLDYVSILDAFYAYKKIYPVIVRGGYYCPSAAIVVLDYLKIRTNNSIMGVPDTYFKFPFSKINGCRLIVQDASQSVRRKVIFHLSKVLKKIN